MLCVVVVVFGVLSKWVTWGFLSSILSVPMSPDWYAELVQIDMHCQGYTNICHKHFGSHYPWVLLVTPHSNHLTHG
jgi:hypothetical protein